MREKPMSKNLPTIKGFVMPDNLHFEEEKSTLIALIKRMAAEGASAITKDPHL